MRAYVPAAFGSFSICASLGFHLALTAPSTATLLTDWFLNRRAFTYSFYAVLLLLSFFLMAAGRPHSRRAKTAGWLASKLGNGYASGAGALLGWTVGLCVGHAFAGGPAVWPRAVVIVFGVAAVAIAPLGGLSLLAPTVTEFNDRWFAPLLVGNRVRVLGYAFFAFVLAVAACDLRS
jgi:hypothetical protein